MTGREHEAREVIADVIVDRRIEIRHSYLALRLDLMTELLVLALDQCSPAQHVDRTMFPQ